MAGTKLEINELAKQIEADLEEKYGTVLTGESLSRALGYPTFNAFRQSFYRGNVPIAVFPMEGRRGKYALAKDVALWLAEQRSNAFPKAKKQSNLSKEDE